MKLIQWYPGHMAKATRLMKDNLKFVDGIALVLDARAFLSCINKTAEETFSGKKILYVINKIDLVEQTDLQNIYRYFHQRQKDCLGIVGINNQNAKKIVDRLFEMLKDVTEKNKAKGINKPLRIMVAGITNTGKSTIINSVCGKKKAETGDKAGVTRTNQWIKLDNLELLDTPGVMPPSLENQKNALHLAYIGSINDDILDMQDLAFEFLAEMKESYPNLILARYKVDCENKTTLEIYEEICKNRGFILRGNDFDYERCARAIINDFRSGKLGKIALDKYE